MSVRLAIAFVAAALTVVLASMSHLLEDRGASSATAVSLAPAPSNVDNATGRYSIDASANFIARTAAVDSCVCYANGTSHSPGARACISGRTMICSDRPSGSGTNCGWAPPKVDSEPERC